MLTACGTPNYVAPEVLDGKGYDGKAADTWSIGVIIFVFLAGRLPFDAPVVAKLFKKIARADYTCPEFFSASAQDLISHILVPDPTKRFTLAEIMNHPWFTEGIVSEPPAEVCYATCFVQLVDTSVSSQLCVRLVGNRIENSNLRSRYCSGCERKCRHSKKQTFNKPIGC